jgi:hypothetical protein
MRKGSRRTVKCDKIRTAETPSADSSVGRTNLKNLSKDLHRNNQRRRRHVVLHGRELHAVTARCRGHPKIAARVAEHVRARMGSAARARAHINLNNLSSHLLLLLLLHSPVMQRHASPFGRELQAARGRRSGLRKTAERRKERIGSAGKAAARTSLNRFKLLRRRGHQRPTHLAVSPRASETNAAAVSRIRVSGLPRAAGIHNPPTCSESRPKRPQRLRKMCSSVVKAAKAADSSQRAARRQSAESPMFNSSASALSNLKVKSPPARQARSNKREVKARRVTSRELRAAPREIRAAPREIRAAPREIRVVPKAKAKAKAAPKAAKGKARRAAANKRLPCGIAVLDFVPETRILSGYEKTFPRSRLLGVHFGFGVCRRLLFR